MSELEDFIKKNYPGAWKKWLMEGERKKEAERIMVICESDRFSFDVLTDRENIIFGAVSSGTKTATVALAFDVTKERIQQVVCKSASKVKGIKSMESL